MELPAGRRGAPARQSGSRDALPVRAPEVTAAGAGTAVGVGTVPGRGARTR